jgi:putative glycosyltransferase
MDVKISVVATLYYSEKYTQEFYTRVRNALLKITQNYEIVFVNDGSPDNSRSRILEFQQSDSRIVLIDLSRNFGHHQAILTGLQHATGDYIFLIDTDLEEDPELLIMFWEKMKSSEDIDVVYGLQEKRKGGVFERTSGSLFYKGLDLLTNFEYPANTFTARLMKRKYVEAVLRYQEKTLDVWAIFAMVGFNQEGVVATKKWKGTSTYTFMKKLRMSLEIMTSLSHRPLYMIFFVGTIWLLLSFFNVIWIFIQKWLYGAEIEGWASIMASVWLIGGITIFLLGLIGIYLSKMFLEIKNRPLSIIKTIYRKD